MKTIDFFQRNALWLLICILMILTISLSCNKSLSDERVQQAYELRMNGDADSALAVLAGVITEDSTNSQALYELARTEHHIGLGNPSSLFRNLDNIRVLINKAVEYDSDNAIYQFYQGYVAYLEAYIGFMRQQPDVSSNVDDVVAVYEALLEMKPDYHEAALYLVEILSVPDEMGGDSTKAQEYAQSLFEKDPVSGAKAKELLLPNSANRIEYWNEILEANPGNSELLEQLGKAYLYQDSVIMGVKYLEEAMKAASGKDVLLLDIARYYLMSSRGDSLKTAKYMPLAEAAVTRYLETEPITPLKAYAYSIMAYVMEGEGNTEQINIMRDKAIEIDPNVSKAFGLPPLLLFSRPDEISHYYGYFSRPF